MRYSTPAKAEALVKASGMGGRDVVAGGAAAAAPASRGGGDDAQDDDPRGLEPRREHKAGNAGGGECAKGEKGRGDRKLGCNFGFPSVEDPLHLDFAGRCRE